MHQRQHSLASLSLLTCRDSWDNLITIHAPNVTMMKKKCVINLFTHHRRKNSTRLYSSLFLSPSHHPLPLTLLSLLLQTSDLRWLYYSSVTDTIIWECNFKNFTHSVSSIAQFTRSFHGKCLDKYNTQVDRLIYLASSPSSFFPLSLSLASLLVLFYRDKSMSLFSSLAHKGTQDASNWCLYHTMNFDLYLSLFLLFSLAKRIWWTRDIGKSMS